jgi:hypothetical protein
MGGHAGLCPGVPAGSQWEDGMWRELNGEMMSYSHYE